jgi:hypothetical protein
MLAAAALSLCLAACGGANKAGQTASQAASTSGGSSPTTTGGATTTASAAAPPKNIPPAPAVTKVDGDGDGDVSEHAAESADNDSVLGFGHEATAAEKSAVTAVVKRYFAAAAAEQGARACGLLISTLAEAEPEDYAETPGAPPYLHGKTCAASMTSLFKHFHPELALEQPRLTVTSVRLIVHHGYAVLHFKGLPARSILIVREGHIWKIDGLLDRELP